LAFGEAYQGMELREIVVEIATKQDIMIQQQAAGAIHMEKLEQKVDSIRCPSALCQDHGHRIEALEKADAEEDEAGKEAKLSKQAWAGIIIMAALAAVSILLQVATMLRGG